MKCPKPDCDFTSPSYQDYMMHVVFEKHGKIDNMRDFAATVYQQAVKQQNPSIDYLVQALRSERTTENAITEENTPKLGYAHKQPKNLPKITEKAETFVRNKFNDGLVAKAKKWKPKQVVDAMMVAKDNDGAKRFRPTEILFVEQVQQLFSKFAAAQKKSTQEPAKKKQKIDEVDVTEMESEGEDLDASTGMDEATRQNRYTNIMTRARRLQMETVIEESFQTVAEAITEE